MTNITSVRIMARLPITIFRVPTLLLASPLDRVPGSMLPRALPEVKDSGRVSFGAACRSSGRTIVWFISCQRPRGAGTIG